MKVIYADNYSLHNPKFEYYNSKKASYAEKPGRIDSILRGCERLGLEVEEVNETSSAQEVSRIHKASYINYLRDRSQELSGDTEIIPSVYIADTYTPLTHHTYEAALRSAQLAVRGAKRIVSGEDRILYALCRPPGHHAEHSTMEGYCYFNNAALAATHMAESGKVAILDIDYHHGNGTQSFFYDRDDVAYVSLHADPEVSYPYKSGFKDETGKGTGEGYNYNFPLPLETTVEEYIDALKKAIDAISKYSPDYLVISVGYDIYENDPIAGLDIDEAGFEAIGRTLREGLKYPTLMVQEGGYNVEKLDVLAERFLKGILNR